MLHDSLLLLPFIFTGIHSYLLENTLTIKNILMLTIPSLYTADLFSGIYHILSDNYFGNIEPLKAISIDSRHHHKDPGAMIHAPVKGAFKEAIFNNIPLYLLSLTLSGPYPLISIFANMTANFGLFAQYSHRLSHMRSHNIYLSYPIKKMQDMHIILNPHIHHYHHKGYDENFAVLNGWSVPVSNLLFKFLQKTHYLYKPLGFDFSSAH